MENKNIRPLFIIMDALRRGYPIFPDHPDQIYKIFMPEELEEGDPGFYYCHKNGMGVPDGPWYPASHVSLNKIIEIAYGMSCSALVVIAANNALAKINSKER